MTKSYGQLSRSPTTDFPKARRIDFERFPTIPQLKKMLLSAGFRNARHQILSAGTTEVSLRDYLQKTEKMFVSTLALLSKEDFKKGLKVFEKKLRGKWTRN